MKKQLALVFLLLAGFFSQAVWAQNNEFRIMSWNIKWLGAPNNCGCDTSIQRQNVELVLNTENPDIVVLQEVVSIKQLDRIARNTGYDYVVSPYCTQAPDTNSGNYPSGQKLAYLYKSSRCQLLDSRGFMASTYPLYSNTNSPYYNFTSGRFPFLAEFKLKSNGNEEQITLLNIHAKAGSASQDYIRRQRASEIAKDSFLLYFSNKKVLFVGDFNDHMIGSINSSSSTTPYKSLLDILYTPLFNQDSFPGEKTAINFNNSIIDNILCSPAAHPWVLSNKSEILDNVRTYISSYATTTSDHYPVISTYLLDSRNGLKNLENSGFEIFPNPHQNSFILNNTARRLARYKILSLEAKLIQEGKLQAGENEIEIHAASGTYQIIIEDRKSQYRHIIIKN